MPKGKKKEDKRISLYPKQWQAYNFDTQFCAVVAGVQSGKTFLGATWCGKKIREYPDGVGVIIAPTYKILQQATLKKFFDLYPLYRKRYKEQKGEIPVGNGGVIFTRSADAPLGLEGISANWIWLDEGGMCSQLTWTVCRSRVSMTRGTILITTTPYNMGWLYTDFYKPWVEGTDKSFTFISWKSTENTDFSKDYFEAERRRLDPREFSRRYEGEFTKMTGLVYDLPEESIIALPDGLKVKSEARFVGVDWGYRNPASVIVIYYHDQCFYVVDEWKEAERTTPEIIQVIKNKMSEHRATRCFPDPAEPDRLEELRRAGIAVYEPNKDIKGGISYINTLIREKRFMVCNSCKATLDEMSMYHYPEDDPDNQKAPKEEPEKFNDHLMDAMRYAIYSFQPMPKEEYKATSPVNKYYPDLGF